MGNLRRIRWCPMGRCGHQPLRVGFEDSVGKRGTLESIRNQRTLRDHTFGVRCFSFLRRWSKRPVVHWDLPKYGQTETEDTMKWKTKRKAVPAERLVPRALPYALFSILSCPPFLSGRISADPSVPPLPICAETKSSGRRKSDLSASAALHTFLFFLIF